MGCVHPGSYLGYIRRTVELALGSTQVRKVRGCGARSRDALPSVSELHQLQGIKPGTVRHAFLALAEEGLMHIRHGPPTTIAGESA